MTKKNNRSLQRAVAQGKTQAESQSSMVFKTIKGKAGLHANNPHRGRYPFQELVRVLPELKAHVVKNPKGEQSIDFSDPTAVKCLNKALLAHYYGVQAWDIPQGYLCPPIPGRADYIHRAAELLSNECPGLKHNQIQALDIGVGANCIYPIVASVAYGWRYVGSDVDPVSVKNANQIVANNRSLSGLVTCRLQEQSRFTFQGIIQPGEYYDITTCNPPFHKSLAEAEQGTQRKLRNLNENRAKRGQSHQFAKPAKDANTVLNFGGQKAELWCPGGEASFIKNMAFESRDFGAQVLWFTSLLSKKENVRWMRKNLEKAGAAEARVYEMSQGQKISRFIAWTFQTPEQRARWFKAKQR